MREGKSAPAALQQLLAEDPQEAVRQVAMVDRGGQGRRAHGDALHRARGPRVGNQVSAQANMMERDTVPRAMVRAYSRRRAPACAERLLAALDAAEAEGGDMRGRQSAAMRRGLGPRDRQADSRTGRSTCAWRTTAIRCGELRRLLELRRAYQHVDVGDELAVAGDLEGALAEYEAAHRAQPGQPRAGLLARGGARRERARGGGGADPPAGRSRRMPAGWSC